MISKLRKLYHSEPFQPFRIVLDDGGKIIVSERTRFSIAPDERFVHVFDDSGSPRKIPVETIREIQSVDPRGSDRKAG